MWRTPGSQKSGETSRDTTPTGTDRLRDLVRLGTHLCAFGAGDLMLARFFSAIHGGEGPHDVYAVVTLADGVTLGLLLDRHTSARHIACA